MKHAIKCLRQVLSRPDVALALGRALGEHRRIELEFKRRVLAAMGPESEVGFPHLKLGPLHYFQRNFFSTLFLSIYRTLGIPSERRKRYGLIVHMVRGVVTATDNILDDEDKGAVRLPLDGGRVIPNVLAILLQEGLLHDAMADLATSTAERQEMWHSLVRALHAIAKEESAEESAVDEALPPERLLETIHSFRGAQLLQLAFVAPAVGEPNLAAKIAAARRGVGRIGLGLQALDDVTDFAEDVACRNHNLLRSWIVHRSPDGPASDGALLLLEPAELASPELMFPQATAEVLGTALELVLDGFGTLHGLGHIIDRAAARSLSELMFDLRGLSHLWRIGTRAFDASVSCNEVHRFETVGQSAL